jgi:NAD(P)-dependent dehydrogenase (short-subunit alcohol dehydrogenase family)
MVSTPGPLADGLLAGRVVVVAGVGPGLGRSVALAAARHGARVVLAARRREPLDSVADEIGLLGGSALVVTADLTEDGAAEHLATTTNERFGGLDVLVYNAFTMGPMAPAARLTAEDWRGPFEINVVAAVRTTLAAAPLLASSTGGGAVVMVNSQAARRSEPSRGPYAASKSALLSAARTLAGELGPQGIRVNSVVPGHIWGEALEGFFAGLAESRGSTPEEVYHSVAKTTALRRIATADEIADAVIFLASPMASAITGQSLDVNAGNWYE